MFLKKHYPWIYTFLLFAFAWKWHAIIIVGIDGFINSSIDLYSKLEGLKAVSAYMECVEPYQAMEGLSSASINVGQAIKKTSYILLSVFLLIALGIPFLVYHDRRMRN